MIRHLKAKLKSLIRGQASLGADGKKFPLAFLDNVIPVHGTGRFISGWVLDPSHQIQSVYWMFGNHRIPIHLNCFHPRADVRLAFSSLAGMSDDPGFFHWLEISSIGKDTLLSDPNTIESLAIHLNNGKTKFFPLPQQFRQVEGIDALREILSFWQLNSTTALNDLSRVFMPAIQTSWQHRQQKKESTTEEFSYGTQVSSPAASVIIPIFRRFDFINFQMAVFANDPYMDYAEIIYIIDDPTLWPGIQTWIADVHGVFHRPFKVVFAGWNRGFAGANNLGASVAKSQRLLFLNSDVIPTGKGWLKKMIDAFDSVSDIGILGSSLRFEDGSLQHDGMQPHMNQHLGNLWTLRHPRKGLPWEPSRGKPDLEPCPLVTGAAMMISRKLFENVGRFDEQYIIGDFEDADLCLKAKRDGKTNFILRLDSMYHLERQSQNLIAGNDLSWREKLTLVNAVQFNRTWADVLPALAGAP